MQQAPKHDIHAPAPEMERRQERSAQPRYFQDAAGHRSLVERLGGHRFHAADGTELEQRWPAGTAILFVAAASAACWAGIAGVVWAIVG